MEWLDTFQLALIKKDEAALLQLIDELPQFPELQQMQKASILIEQAIELFKEKKETSASEMRKIKQAKAYLES